MRPAPAATTGPAVLSAALATGVLAVTVLLAGCEREPPHPATSDGPVPASCAPTASARAAGRTA
ncbi:hypothetical protein ACFSNO_11380 [Streptomyces cirratus]